MASQIVMIDANVVLRYLLRDDENLYKTAEKFFNDVFLGKKKALLNQSVIAEIVYVLQKLYKVERGKITEVLTELLKSRNIVVQDKNIIEKSFNIYASTNLDYVDCLLCAYSEKFEVLTFDKRLKKCVSNANSDAD